ncbi:MAG: hypothetical protein IPL65_03280 [Lewinellaceae bacterium]|nr:hypothetical protein [Lewinellaceae bacterium]
MMKHNLILNLVVVLMLGLSACQPDFKDMVEKEKATGIRNDSLFLGYHFGMSQDSFYKHSFHLNQQGVVTNGPENNSVLYAISGYDHPIDMNFYPDFEDRKIYKMLVLFNYNAWAPWNKQLFTKNLLPHVLDLLSKWYGKELIKYKDDKGLPFWAVADGNRMIKVIVQNERLIRVNIIDSSVTPKPTPQKAPDGPRPLWEKKN